VRTGVCAPTITAQAVAHTTAEYRPTGWSPAHSSGAAAAQAPHRCESALPAPAASVAGDESSSSRRAATTNRQGSPKRRRRRVRRAGAHPVARPRPAPRAGPDTFIKMHIYAYEHILFEPGRRLFKPGRRPRMAAEAAHGGRSSA